MQKVLLSAWVLLGLVACQEPASESAAMVESTSTAVAAQAPAGTAVSTDNQLTTAEWPEKVHDFGNIPQGAPVTHTFKVVNTGDQPLTIADVKASCGCTATEYTREAIPPGGEGIVQARYNAAAVGVFNKSVTVTYNTATQREILMLKGTVSETK